jgi:hypothetical protein
MKLKPSKCRFAQQELEYVGHVVSRGGLKNKPAPSRSCSTVSGSKVSTRCSSVSRAVVLLPEVHPQLRKDCLPITPVDLQECPVYLDS